MLPKPFDFVTGCSLKLCAANEARYRQQPSPYCKWPESTLKSIGGTGAHPSEVKLRAPVERRLSEIRKSSPESSLPPRRRCRTRTCWPWLQWCRHSQPFSDQPFVWVRAGALELCKEGKVQVVLGERLGVSFGPIYPQVSSGRGPFSCDELLGLLGRHPHFHLALVLGVQTFWSLSRLEAFHL